MTAPQIIAGFVGAVWALYLLATLFEVATTQHERLNAFGWSLQVVAAALLLAYASGAIG